MDYNSIQDINKKEAKNITYNILTFETVIRQFQIRRQCSAGFHVVEVVKYIEVTFLLPRAGGVKDGKDILRTAHHVT